MRESGISLIELILQLCQSKWESLYKGRYHFTLIDVQCDKEIIESLEGLSNSVWKITNVEYINNSLTFKIKDNMSRNDYVFSGGDTLHYRDIYSGKKSSLFELKFN